jgi:hypothetical protein
MIETENRNPNPESSRTLKDDPQYFGSYLNMARLNVYNISNHLALRFNFSKLDSEELISSSFLTGNQKQYLNKQRHIYSKLKIFFPIVKVFDDESLPKSIQEALSNNTGVKFNELTESLNFLFRELSELRNDYTHYYNLNNGIIRKLQVSDALAAFLQKSFNYAIEYTKSRFKDVFEEKDFSLVSIVKITDELRNLTLEGMVFFTCLFLDRENAFAFINKIKFLKGTQNNSFKAKREVLCAYCVKLPHEKLVSEDSIQAFSLELINELSKCPKILYHVITDEEKEKYHTTLGKEQMLNVIENSVSDTIEDFESYIESISKKVRNENRFHYFALKFLDEKEVFSKLRFQIDLGKLILDEYTKTLNNVDEERVVIENAKAFGRLHDLKKLVAKTDNLSVEGISEMEPAVLRKISFANKVKFEQFAPHYNFDNNKIGINLTKEATAIFVYREKSEKKVKAYLKQPEVDAFLSVHELGKIILFEYLNKGSVEKIINDFILLNNSHLFNLNFIEEVKVKFSNLEVFKKRSQGKRSPHAYFILQNEKKIIDAKSIDELESRKVKLDEILKEHNLNHKQIPTRIIDYWLNIKDVDERAKASDRIKLMKRDCTDRIKSYKKGNVLRIGEMATFIVKDMVDMIISAAKKEKITSFYYDKMQECIALYADVSKKELFLQLISELGLNSEGGHPFTDKIDFENYRYTSDIYLKYIEQKELWLMNHFYVKEKKEFVKKHFETKELKDFTVVKIPSDSSRIPLVFRKFLKNKESFENWYQNVTKGKEKNDRKKPIDLPTNIFDEPLKILLQNILSKNNVTFSLDSNHNELFKLWWDKIRNDKSQEFYNAKRGYEFEGVKLNFDINSKPFFTDYVQADVFFKIFEAREFRRKSDEKLQRRKLPPIQSKQLRKKVSGKIASVERELRIQKEQDMLMLLMFEQLFGNTNEVKLCNIERLLNETIEVKQPVIGYLSFDEMGHRIEKKTIGKLIEKDITEIRKRKEYSVLKKYIYDRRMPELFEYFEEESIPLTKIKDELNSYSKSKDIIFDEIFKLEEAILDKYKGDVIKDANENMENNKISHIQHKPYLNLLNKKELITEKEYIFLNMVRNTFSHNQFPQRSTILKNVEIKINEPICSQILEQYKLIVKRVKQAL